MALCCWRQSFSYSARLAERAVCYPELALTATLSQCPRWTSAAVNINANDILMQTNQVVARFIAQSLILDITST